MAAHALSCILAVKLPYLYKRSFFGPKDYALVAGFDKSRSFISTAGSRNGSGCLLSLCLGYFSLDSVGAGKSRTGLGLRSLKWQMARNCDCEKRSG
jgi:hypothetical protein